MQLRKVNAACVLLSLFNVFMEKHDRPFMNQRRKSRLQIDFGRLKDRNRFEKNCLECF